MSLTNIYQSNMSNFIQDCLKDPSVIKKFDHYVHIWHEGGSDKELHEFLGMSWAEYGFYIANEDYIHVILANRKKNKKMNLLSEESTLKIRELIDAGWEFYLHYCEHGKDSNIKGSSWQVDFTRMKHSGGYDNHECGYSLDADEAVSIAFQNIKDGKRLKKF